MTPDGTVDKIFYDWIFVEVEKGIIDGTSFSITH